MIPRGNTRTCQARTFMRDDYLGIATPTGQVFLPVVMVKWSSVEDDQITMVTVDLTQHIFKFNEYITYQTRA